MTVLLLREQQAAVTQRYFRWVSYPLGVLFTVGSVVFTASIYTGDWLQVWSAPVTVPPEVDPYFRFHVSTGPLYPFFVALIAGTTIAAAINLWLGSRLPLEADRRRHFAWLLLSAALFILGGNSLTLVTWLSLEWWPTWVSHLVIGVAMVLMALNVAAYSLLLQGELIRADFRYFLTALAAVCGIYALVVVIAAGAYSFQLLGLLAITLILVILSHALLDLARRGFDRLFFPRDVQRLRASLMAVVQSEARTRDLEDLLNEVRAEITEISEEHFLRLTEEALRGLNDPARLASPELLTQIPRAIRTQSQSSADTVSIDTPLAQAHALRGLLVEAVERLKPPSDTGARVAPGTLKHAILYEEYVLGRPNVQIIMRHAISEATFHRHRREAVSIVARELKRQEELLSQKRVEGSEKQ